MATSRLDRLAGLSVDPLVITAGASAATIVVVLAAGPSLLAAAALGALVAGWSSAWSP